MSTLVVCLLNFLMLMATFSTNSAEELSKFSFVAKRPFGKMNFTSTKNFVDLLRGDFYIDKTMLISLVVKFEKYKIIAIHIPSKWGKSMNLNMIKSFLGIQVDEEGRRYPIESTASYKLFYNAEIVNENGEIELLKRPLLISSCKAILNRYLGRYPIVYLDFENLVGSSYNKLIKRIGKRVKAAYDEHPYIEQVIRNELANNNSLKLKKISPKRLNIFLELLKKNLDNDDDVVRSIKLLTEILYWIHESRRPYILVDNYDGILLGTLANSAISEEGAMKTLNFFASLLTMFQTNPYQKRVIFMGTFSILETIRDLRSIKEYKALNNILMPFHSISYDNVSLLFERLKIPSFQRTKALNWYKGYRWGKDLQGRIFSMFSIAKFISTGEIDYCRKRNVVIDSILENIVDSLTIRWFILMRLYGQIWRILPKVQRGISSKNFLDLKGYLVGSKTDDDVFICFPFEPFLRSMGSLTMQNILERNDLADSFMIHYTISSNEARMELAEKLVNFYHNNFNISSDLFEQGVEEMAQCLNGHNSNCTGFVEFVEYVSQNVPLVNEMIELSNVRGVTPSAFMGSIFHYLSLRLSLSYDFIVQSVDEEEDEDGDEGLGLGLGWKKIILFNEQCAFIVEVQVCSSAEYMINTAKRKHDKNPKYPKLRETKFMAVNIAANGSVDLRSEFLKSSSVVLDGVK